MARLYLVLLTLSTMLGACTQRAVCPAFQSAFIYDKEALRKKFSYFKEDSTPKVLTASKNKYLVAEEVSYSKKVRSLQTVEMKDINPVVPDSLSGKEEVSKEELDRAARSVIDSTFIPDLPAADSVQNLEDSVYVISRDKEHRLLVYNPDSLKYKVVEVRYNTDQDSYMWYLRRYLVLPDVRLAMINKGNKKKEKEIEGKKKKKKKKGLFRKRKEEAADTTAIKKERVAEENEFDFVETDSTASTPPEAQEGRKKKKRKADKAIAPGEDTPKKKKEKRTKKTKDTAPPPEEGKKEEDDGF